MRLDRRQFLAELSRLGAAAAAGPALWRALCAAASSGAGGAEKPALHWRAVEDGVLCELCPRAETLRDGEVGFCHVRRNSGGRLVTLACDRPCVVNVVSSATTPMYSPSLFRRFRT